RLGPCVPAGSRSCPGGAPPHRRCSLTTTSGTSSGPTPPTASPAPGSGPGSPRAPPAWPGPAPPTAGRPPTPPRIRTTWPGCPPAPAPPPGSAPPPAGRAVDAAERPVDEVAAELEALGLVPVEHPAPDPQIPAGHVISPDPIAGKRLALQSEIHLVVSTGAPVLQVPNVMGMSAADARSTLEEAGFRVEPENETRPSTEDDAGKVVDTSPAPGTQTPSDRPVRLVVGSGPEQVQVPGVVGQS